MTRYPAWAWLLLPWLLLLALAGLIVGVAGQPVSAAPLAPIPAEQATPPERATPVKWLGNPIAGEQYSARHIWDLQAWRGRVYLGYGDWGLNLGPVDIWYYTPTAGVFLSETVYASPERPAAPVDEESIDRYVVIDGDLYIPGTDPKDPWVLGNFYRNDGTGWVKYRTIPDGIHAFDMAGYQGELFAAIGDHNNAPLVRSVDEGLTWTSAISGVTTSRFYELYELAGTLFAVQTPTAVYTKPRVYRYQEPWFVSTTIELVPDRPDDQVLIYDGVFPFRDTILYIPWFWDEAITCTRPITALYQAQPEGNGQHVPFFDDRHPRDVVVSEGRVYVLTAGAARCIWDTAPPDPAGYTTTVYASTDLTTWIPAATAHFTETPIALEVFDHRAYVGTHNGDVYALPLYRPYYLPLIFRQPAGAWGPNP